MDPEWIDLAAGRFWMGGGPKEDENPRHAVRLQPFRLARAPVVREDYCRFLAATGRPEPPFWNDPAFGHPRMPAVGPSWEDAVAYCLWFRQETGTAARLPTEAEWECAAKAGREALYPWGDDPPESLPDYAGRWLAGPEPVDSYPSLHPLGFLGLGENVHEWCADWYDTAYYEVSPVDAPAGPAIGSRRASRGGSWRHQIKGSRSAARSSIPPRLQYADYGFRLAAPAEETP
ncbi:MAG TPA: SUMF1/EgtB/PvdO family nonheme iron enzyme [Thermoanaerobaculia bacterium]|nr:SUMF1/EgtB/PvdO family nonheme iron enzyme [Thermoanaerobaculia bacterium]